MPEVTRNLLRVRLDLLVSVRSVAACRTLAVP